jgi:hypothetical protein
LKPQVHANAIDLPQGLQAVGRGLPNLPLEDLLQLVHLYAERGSPKHPAAARRWLVRYLTDGTTSLQDVAKLSSSLARPASS